MIKRMDVNSDGILSKDEICGGFKEEFGLVLSPVELEALAVLFDGDGDGEVTFSEFRSAILTQSDKLHGKAVFNDCVQQMVQEMDRKGTSSFELLKAIDRDGSGDIDAKEFGIGVEAHLGLKLSDDDVVTLFKQFDLDGSGIIDSAEFISVMAKIRGEPDLQTAMEVIVDWMASKHLSRRSSCCWHKIRPDRVTRKGRSRALSRALNARLRCGKQSHRCCRVTVPAPWLPLPLHPAQCANQQRRSMLVRQP